MKSIKNHFVISLSVGILIIAVAGIYYFSGRNANYTPSELEVVNAIMANWKDIAPSDGANLPHDIQFIGNNKVIVSYEENFVEHSMLLSYSSDLTFSIIDRGTGDASADRNRYIAQYGNPNVPFIKFVFTAGPGGGNILDPRDWTRTETPNVPVPKDTVIPIVIDRGTTTPDIPIIDRPDPGYIIIDNNGEPDRVETKVKLKQGN